MDTAKWFAIGVKNGWPFLLTFLIALGLISQLNKGTQLETPFNIVVSIDAYLWPAVSGTSTEAMPAASNTQKSKQDMRDLPPINGKALHVILAMTTAIFIFLNTFMYLWEARKPSRDGNFLLSLAWILTFICEAGTIIWGGSIYYGGHWVEVNGEYVPLVIFLIFIFVDLVTYLEISSKYSQNDTSGNTRGKKTNKAAQAIQATEQQETKQFALNQMLLVDFPVVVGIGAALMMEANLVGRFAESTQYFQAFFSGAIVMHLAASQFIYFILAMKKDYALEKISK